MIGTESGKPTSFCKWLIDHTPHLSPHTHKWSILSSLSWFLSVRAHQPHQIPIILHTWSHSKPAHVCLSLLLKRPLPSSSAEHHGRRRGQVVLSSRLTSLLGEAILVDTSRWMLLGQALPRSLFSAPCHGGHAKVRGARKMHSTPETHVHALRVLSPCLQAELFSGISGKLFVCVSGFF